MVFPVLPARFTTVIPRTSELNTSAGLVTLTGASGGADTVGGVILGVAGLSAPVTWTGTVTSTNPDGFTTLEGRVSNELTDIGEGFTLPTDPDLLADGFDESGGLAIDSTNASTTVVTSTIAYNFSQPLPTGTSFMLWDPGANVNGVNGTFTFTVTAANGSTPVSTAGWTVTAVDPFTGAADAGTYSFNAATGTLTVTNYDSGSLNSFPQKVLIITPNTPVTSISVSAQTLTYDAFGLSVVVPAAQNTTTTDTVVGVSNTTLSIPFNTPRDAESAEPFLDKLSASVSGGTATVYAATGSHPASPTGAAFLESTIGGAASVGSYRGFITDATGVTTLTGGSYGNQSIVAGTGGLIFTALSGGAGGGNIHAGGGNDLFVGPSSGTGSWNVRFGTGTNTVVSGAGADTVDAGTGANLEFLGAGNSTVTSEGTDTIVGGAGTLDVDGLGPGALVFAGSGGLDFTAAAGANTIAGSTASETLIGGGGTMLSFSFGPTQYTGGSGSDTIVAVNNVAGTGALTVSGGSGNSLYFGAAAGGNDIFGGTGSATIFGGGAGDVLSTGGSGVNVVAAGQGAETVDASQSSGTNTVFLNSGADSVTGGSGVNAYQIGTGAATITGGGTANLYVLYNLGGTSRTLEITDFNPATDFVKLNGYSGGDATAYASETSTAGGGTLVTLPDGTKITFDGVSHVAQSSFT